ncbi:MAG: sporulation protein YabP [Firmicutes bacterium]|nr:sporulation protein YabP [Bacillota bacterium]MDD4263779.1 sporulation protein YabP [Bacillota bacterium]MDD4693769.1 sporulation protein YabP [Bacillota bacterium]
MAIEEKRVGQLKNHQVVLKNRQELGVEGVVSVDSFDDEEVVLETEEGLLVIRGDNLHVSQLNIDAGKLSVTGSVRTLEYLGDSGHKSGFLGKFFR